MGRAPPDMLIHLLPPVLLLLATSYALVAARVTTPPRGVPRWLFPDRASQREKISIGIGVLVVIILTIIRLIYLSR